MQLDIREGTEEVAKNLNMKVGAEVYYVTRIRYINGQTLCFEESYYNKSIVPYLNNEIATESIFHYIKEALGLKIGFSDMFMNIGKLNEEEAGYLGQPTGSPKLSTESIFYLTNGQPFDFSKVTYNYEQSQFFVQGNRDLYNF